MGRNRKSRFNFWDILHSLTTKDVVEVKSDNLDADHIAIYKTLKYRNLSEYVNIGKDRGKGKLVLSKKLKSSQ